MRPLFWQWFKFGIKLIITARKRSLGQGNIFAPVCHSVHRGGGACSGCVCVLQGGCLVPGGVLVGVPGPRGVCFWGVPGLGGGGVPGGDHPPGTATAAGGTHPTGMHSCVENIFGMNETFGPVTKLVFKVACICEMKVSESNRKTSYIWVTSPQILKLE